LLKYVLFLFEFTTGEVMFVKELVGECKACKKPVFCNDGFINGVVLDDNTLICFECFNEESEISS
jgi:hypothetical protein